MVELFGNDLPSEIKNPFKFECIEGIHIHYGKYPFSGKPYFDATIEFKQGNTNGSQKIEGKDLTDVFIKVMEFCKSLDNV